MTQFFLLLKACSQSVCVHCMRDVFLISESKKAMMQFFWLWFLKSKQQDTQVTYNKDSVIKGDLRKDSNERRLKKKNRQQIEFALA